MLRDGNPLFKASESNEKAENVLGESNFTAHKIDVWDQNRMEWNLGLLVASSYRICWAFYWRNMKSLCRVFTRYATIPDLIRNEKVRFLTKSTVAPGAKRIQAKIFS